MDIYSIFKECKFIRNVVFGMRSIIDTIFTKVSLFWIYIYQKTISPDKGLMSYYTRGTVCRHEPHCSEYAVQSLKARGFLDSAGDIATRVINCKPGYDKIYDPAKYKVVFASSSQIGLPFLEEIIDNPWFELVGIITQPDKEGGRGMKKLSNPIKKFWQDKLEIDEIPILEPTKLNPEKSKEGKDFVRDLQLLDPDFVVVISYGRIIPQAVLDIPKFGAINIHGSKLPDYRGASPIQTSLVNGDMETGITIMHMDAGLDTGDVLDILPIKIYIDDTAETIINKFGLRGPQFMSKTLVDRAKGKVKRKKQNHELANHTSKISKEDAKIDIYNDDLVKIYHKYQGYYLRPKVRFELGEKRFIIEKIEINKDNYKNNRDNLTGKLIDNKKLNPLIQNIYIKPEGKKTMDRSSFVNGYIK